LLKFTLSIVEPTNYLRFGDDDGFRPLVLYRFFWGAFSEYVEIDEEFRLYHDLAEDKERNLLLSFDESGREIEVVKFTPDKVLAQLKHLRQFQAGTGLYLAIYFDSKRYSKILIEDVPTYKKEFVDTDNLIRWLRVVEKCEFPRNYKYNTFSRILGKVILPPPSRKNARVWPYKDGKNKKDISFIVGVDKDGNDVELNSNPDKLDNHTYLTPVCFRREVLEKYFAEPERYKVSDGRLSCLNLWSCQIDNDLDSYVVVFLGDLGRDLPYDEQLHWRQFNVAAKGGVSETNFRRSFLNQFTNARSPDLIFRQKYSKINQIWERALGWPLFLQLELGDEHLLTTVRVPVTNSQVEFDEQIICLTKLVVDSLNEKGLVRAINENIEKTKGIDRLEVFLEKTGFTHRKNLIQLLRDIQSLRSSGSAHRKGSNYQKISKKLGVDPKNKPDAIRKILEELIIELTVLQNYYCSSQ